MTPLNLSPARKRGPSRRQMLKILGASAALPMAVAGLRMFGPQPTFHDWQGTALGAEASMRLWHANEGHAQRTLLRMASEVNRLENVFSLFRPHSEISRLNRDGHITGASRDLTAVLTAARGMADLSAGAFDPSVQPLWSVYRDHFASPGADAGGPLPAVLDAARGRVDYRRIDIAANVVRFGAPGMAVTLNGIAQGYITDVVSDLLRNEGFDHVVVELGESRVLGTHPDGRPWRVGLRDSAGATGRHIDLVDAASATSGGYGTVFDSAGRHHHIFDPATGKSANRVAEAVVIAPRAMDADALATALVVADIDAAPAIIAASPGASAFLTSAEGVVTHV